jgi:hypothetical protein
MEFKPELKGSDVRGTKTQLVHKTELQTKLEFKTFRTALGKIKMDSSALLNSNIPKIVNNAR